MKDNEGNSIEPGDIVRHSFGIPPTTVDLFVFGDSRASHLHLIDAKGVISTLDEYFAENSYIVRREE
jgi:hypothetical protein